jgi:hypothetical protein
MGPSLELQTLDWLRLREGMSDEHIARDYCEHHLAIARRHQALAQSGLMISHRLVAPRFEYLPESVKALASALLDREINPSPLSKPETSQGSLDVQQHLVDVKIRVLSPSGVGELNRHVSAALLEYWSTLETYEGHVYSYLHVFMPDDDHTREVVLVRKQIWNDVFGKLEPFADDGDEVYEAKLQELIEAAKACETYKLLTLSK